MTTRTDQIEKLSTELLGDLENMPDRKLDQIAYEEIMGKCWHYWKRRAPEKIKGCVTDECSKCGVPRVGTDPKPSPTTDLNDAMKCVEQIWGGKPERYIDMGRTPTEAYVNLHCAKDGLFSSSGSTFPQMLTIAAIKAKRGAA